MDLYKMFPLEKSISINDFHKVQQLILLVIAWQYLNGIHYQLMCEIDFGNLYPVLINVVK